MVAATQENVGKRMAIVVDGKTNSAPVIQIAIPSGAVGFECKSEADAARVAAGLAPSTAR